MKKKPRIKQQINFIEKTTLSPFQRYSRFSIFPWKFILHLLLVVLCTYEALKVVSIQDKHTRTQEQVFSKIYLQNDEGTTNFAYYNLADFTDTFFGIIKQTEKLNQSLLQFSNVNDVHYKLDVYYSEMDPLLHPVVVFKGNSSQFIHALQKIPLHEQKPAEMKKFIEEVQQMHLEVANIITYIQMNDKGTMQSCLNWTVHIAYNFESFANVESQLTGQSYTCSIDGIISVDQSLFSIHIAVMLISMLSLLLAWNQIYDISKDYMIHKSSKTEYKNQIQQQKLQTDVDWRKNWDDLDFSEKMKFFDFWFIITTTGNFLQVFGAFVAILDDLIDDDYLIFQHKQLLIGFGVMFGWISILQYLRTNNNINIMSATLSKSSNNLFMFLLGVMPFFLGFVFLGQTIFWKYNKFQDTSSSVITLFSLVNGDIVSDTFLETWAEGFTGQLYLILFMILFYTAVQNVFVTIIMEGYEESLKEKQYKDLLKQKQQKQVGDHQHQQQDIGVQNQLKDIEPIKNQHLTHEQQVQLLKFYQNGKKINKILDDILLIQQQINQTQITINEQKYLNNMVKDNFQSAYRTIKMGLKINS